MKAANGCSRAIQKVAWTLQHLLTAFTTQIVVAEHHYGHPLQLRAEHPFTAGIEGVAIDQCDGAFSHAGAAVYCR